MTHAAASDNVAQLRMPSIAPLRNVALMRRMAEHLIKRSANLPGIGAMYGQAGLGKSNACAHVAAALRAVYVEVRSHFTKKSFLLAILAEMQIKPGHTIAEMVDQICQELMLSRKVLVLDEGDYLIKRNLIELVRDIYEGSDAPIILVGEETFPLALKRASERFYDRVLKWQPAERSDLDDARKLAKLYSPDVEIADDLLSAFVENTKGIARKIAVNINDAHDQGKSAGKRSIGLKDWGGRAFYTGEAPQRRV